jgi:hypothetical protein
MKGKNSWGENEKEELQEEGTDNISIVFILCSVSFIACVVLCVVFCLSVMCVICVLCLIVVSLPVKTHFQFK